MASIPPAYRSVLAEHRRRMRRLSSSSNLSSMHKTYEEAIAVLERKLRKLPGGHKDRFTAHQHRLYLGQLRQGVKLLTRMMAGNLGDLSHKAQKQGLKDLIGDVSKLEKSFTGAEVLLPVEEVAHFQGVVTGVRESMVRVHESSMAKYGGRLARKFEDQLSMGLALGEDLGTIIERVNQVGSLEWYQAERIARTELIFAYNATQKKGIQESAAAVPGMMMRWTEHVSDEYKPLDTRVADDSLAMHGQVAPPSGVFHFPATMPSGAPIPKELRRFAGMSWSNPPNRPNDRASLAPWRSHWGVPAWRQVNGRRVGM